MANRVLWLSVVLLFATNYNSCFTFVKGECSSETATWSNYDLGESPISLLNGTGYCFVNECTIRIKESNIYLNVINTTRDWIEATDMTNLFTIPVTSNKSVTFCSLESSLDNPNANYFIILSVITFIIVSSSSLNIVLHLSVKKLRSTPGFIIIGICGTIIITYIALMITAVFQYLHRVNGNTAICAVFKYMSTSFAIIYTMLKATYLFHLAYLMYRTYRSHPYQEMNKKLLCIYGAVNITAGTIGSLLIIILDLSQERIVLVTHNGYCTGHFFNDVEPSEYLYSRDTFLTPLLTIVTAIGIVFFIIALTLYYLTTKCLCTCSGMTGPNDIRVSITLISSTALGALTLVIFLFAGVDGDESVIASGIAVCLEQVVLLTVFVTSTKARDKLQKCFERKETETEGG